MDGITELKSVFNPFNGAPVFYTDITASTMDLAREYVTAASRREEVKSGTVFSAGFQTAGRGRIAGRKWIGETKQNLAFTVILDKNEPGGAPFPLSLTSGLGLALYFENKHLMKPMIKWPNDILIRDKKISGIIVESTKDFFFVGVGININQLYFSGEIKGRATSLALETGETFPLKAELKGVLASLRIALSLGEKRKEIEKRLYFKGCKVAFVPGDPGKEKPLEGVICGIDNNGLLILETADGTVVKAASGEITYQENQ